MNIGSKLLAAGLLVGLIGCSTEETVYVDNMDEMRRMRWRRRFATRDLNWPMSRSRNLNWITSRRRPSTRSNSRRAGMNTNLTSMPGPGAS